jgi:hypothetical protein
MLAIAGKLDIESVTDTAFNILREFCNYATIQGLVYIARKKITTFGRGYWISAVCLMFSFGLFVSVTLYMDWDEHQVEDFKLIL